AVISLLQKEIKNRREALEEAQKVGRADLVENNQAEIAVLEAFLPKAMSADELRALIQAAIAESGATSLAEMGKVMKLVMPKVAGRAPGDAVSQMVRELLAG
ncbi:MAG: GatB/YqeY domain-containing protein, partial [Anaerolineae bacterium]